MVLVQKYKFWCFLCKNIYWGRIPYLCFCQLRILFNLKSAKKIMMIWKQCGKTESWKSQITLGNVVSMFVLKGSIMWLIQGSRLLLWGEVLQAVVSNWEARGGECDSAFWHFLLKAAFRHLHITPTPPITLSRGDKKAGSEFIRKEFQPSQSQLHNSYLIIVLSLFILSPLLG